MKNSAYVRFSITFLLLLSLLSPVAALAGDGKKFFNEGLKYEASEEWDKAVEQFAKAVVENPKNPEYRLHLTRALFNASQMYMKKGTMAANQKDYVGAYNAFRAAYGYDPVNELAKSEMERMVRLQQELLNGDGKSTGDKTKEDGVKLIPTGYSKQNLPAGVTIPQQLEKLRDVPFPSGVDLQYLIKELAKDLDLNVLFDQESRLDNRKVKIELKNVTAAKALDYIFLQENLFFQKVGPRTIIVANGNQRTKFQQLVLRTFYLANADPTEVAKVIQSAIPVQPGRTPTIPLIDKSTNSITVRDTTENIKIIADLIRALDKDRAEVVMDVQIYEVTKNDLMQFGNQVGTAAQLQNLGGSTQGVILAGDGPNVFSAGGQLIRETFGVGLIIPAINLVALQNKQNTKLIASTQIHAFNNEDSSARIGQRVPVRTATFQTGNTNNTNGVVSDVINYEQVGLTLKFKPIVFPNQDVQVVMEIESKDVAGAQTLTPTFTERTIKGTARVQNNKTLLLASVAQNVQSNGRSGLPLLGLIPILGRLFTAPTKDNRQVDIVIAITPRVIRAPAILPEDEAERPTGSLQTPTSGSLEAMIIQEEIEEQLAMMRKKPTNVEIQLPDQKQEMPTYVKSNPATTDTNASTETQKPVTENPTETTTNTSTVATNLKPIDTSVKTLQITPTVDSAENNTALQETALKTENPLTEAAKANAPLAQLQILPTLSEMKTGEKAKLAIIVRSATAFRSAVLGLKFDASKVAVRAVSYGDVFGKDVSQTPVTPFVNEKGKMFVSLFTAKDVAENSSGILAYVEIEALADGKPQISFDADILNFLTSDGKNFQVKF
jgi:general secretion pathway protein D